MWPSTGKHISTLICFNGRNHLKMPKQNISLIHLSSCFQQTCTLARLAYLGLRDIHIPNRFAFCSSFLCCHKHYIDCKPVSNSEQTNNSFCYEPDQHNYKLKYSEHQKHKNSSPKHNFIDHEWNLNHLLNSLLHHKSCYLAVKSEMYRMICYLNAVNCPSIIH